MSHQTKVQLWALGLIGFVVFVLPILLVIWKVIHR